MKNIFPLKRSFMGDSPSMVSLLERLSDPDGLMHVKENIIDFIKSLYCTKGEHLESIKLSVDRLVAQNIPLLVSQMETYSDIDWFFCRLDLTTQSMLLNIMTRLACQKDCFEYFSNSIPWTYLTDAFFNRHQKCSIFLVQFSYFMESMILLHDQRTVSLLRQTKFFDLLIQNVNTNSGSLFFSFLYLFL